MVTPTPMRPSSSMVVVTSCRWGTLPMRTGASASRVPARMGRAAFFAPEMRTSPSRRWPPPTSSLSMPRAGSVAGRHLRRRQRAYGQRVDLSAHPVTQRAIDLLVALQRPQALELVGHHQGAEMDVVLRLHFDPGRGQARPDQLRKLFTVHVLSNPGDMPGSKAAEFNGWRALARGRNNRRRRESTAASSPPCIMSGRHSPQSADRDRMLSYSLATLAGFVLLMWGADRFVVGAAGTARNLGVPPLLIGLTLVGMATSGPEIFVAITASLSGDPALAAGNAIGSNIANIGLVLGATALVMPISVKSVTLRREMPTLLVVTLVMAMVFFNLRLGRVEGVLLIVTLVLVLYWLVVLGSRSGVSDPIGLDYAAEIPENLPMPRALQWLALGLVVLLTGSNLLVWGAENLALTFGVSELVIGLTVVAIGTSLPELAVSMMSAFKGEHDMAIGNIIGSNLFNSLAVVGVAALIHPATFDTELLVQHMPVMVGMTLALFLLTYNFNGQSRIGRLEGGLLLVAFLCYHGWIVTR